MKIDERHVSWKVLLPHGPDASVLAIGLDAGALLGLARTWKRVDCLGGLQSVELQNPPPELRQRIWGIRDVNEISKQYQIVMLGPNTGSLLKSPHFCLKYLAKPDATVVYLVPRFYRQMEHELRSIGLTSVAYYAALPRRKPKLFFCTSSPILRSRGLMFHTPGRSWVRWGMRAMKTASDLGWKYPWGQDRVIFANPNNMPQDNDGLPCWLSHRLGLNIDGFVVYAGSDSMRRKITVLVLCGGDKEYIVKIADTEAAASALRNESFTLDSIYNSGLRGLVPQLICSPIKLNEYNIQIQSVVSGNCFVQNAELGRQHFQFLIKLSKINRKTLHLDQVPAWIRLQATVQSQRTSALPTTVGKALEMLLRKGTISIEVPCHQTHGDFTPWNIRWSHNVPYVIDWEDGEPLGLPFSDAIHFLCSRRELNKRIKAARMTDDMYAACSQLASEAGFSNSIVNHVLLVWLLTQYFQKADPYIAALLEIVLSRTSS